jgi:uncharacterized protein (TIGR00369 family)
MSDSSAVPDLPFGANIPFVAHLGFEMIGFEGGHSEMRFDPRPEHLNSYDVVHGGAIMALLDVSMATAARSIDKSVGVVTIEMKTSFMQAARGPLLAKGRLIHRTKSMAFTETSMFDAQGQLCAQATGTFKYVPKRQPANNVSTD